MASSSDESVLHRQLLLQLGDRLRRLRKDNKITTVELAKRAGISRTTLYSVEAGDPTPSMGTYLRVMGAMGVAADLALVAGDLLHPSPAGTAAGRSLKPKPQVQVIVRTDNTHHQAQDLQSLVLNEAAVEWVKSDPERLVEAQRVLSRWMTSASPDSMPLLLRWEEILREQQWSKVLGRTRHAQELRQSSPLTVLLPKSEREKILQSVAQLKKGMVFGDQLAQQHITS